jgi:sec-independent protein translocase protein TatB
VQKHLFDDINGDSATAGAAAQPSRPAASGGPKLAPGERPPFDPDAT